MSHGLESCRRGRSLPAEKKEPKNIETEELEEVTDNAGDNEAGDQDATK